MAPDRRRQHGALAANHWSDFGFIREAAAETQLTMAGSVITTIPILILYFATSSPRVSRPQD